MLFSHHRRRSPEPARTRRSRTPAPPPDRQSALPPWVAGRFLRGPLLLVVGTLLLAPALSAQAQAGTSAITVKQCVPDARGLRLCQGSPTLVVPDPPIR